MRTILAALLALSLAAAARAQTFTLPEAQQVQLLAPQLVPFSGSMGNFESLVSGLTAGTPVTLTTLGADGVMQIVTFLPGATMSAADAARALETARQNLISQGIATPSAQQLAQALVGGSTSTLQVRNELIPAASVAGNSALNLSAANLQAVRTALAQGTGGPVNDFEVNQTLQLASTLLAQQGIFNPTPEQLRVALVGGNLVTAAGTSVLLQGVLQGRVRNTSDSPLFGTSNSRFIGTSNTPPSAGPAVTPAPVSGAAGVRPPGTGAGAIRPGARPGG